MSAVVELWRRGQAGWPRRFPLVQLPNAPLVVALGARAVARSAKPGGGVQAAARSVFAVGLGVWAWEELVHGENWLRRLLGAVGLWHVVAARTGQDRSRPPRALRP